MVSFYATRGTKVHRILPTPGLSLGENRFSTLILASKYPSGLQANVMSGILLYTPIAHFPDENPELFTVPEIVSPRVLFTCVTP